ncbi:hypothetical protein CHUAL_010832 [Chamberlinius hualienensis]
MLNIQEVQDQYRSVINFIEYQQKVHSTSMELIITNLPLEIQELILKWLDVQSLITAMRCCSLWHQIGQVTLKSWCTNHISKDIILEIVDRRNEIDWLHIILEWSYFPTFLTSTFQPLQIFPSTHIIQKLDHLPVAISGDYLFAAHLSKIFTVIHSLPKINLDSVYSSPHYCIDLKLARTANDKFVIDQTYPDKYSLHNVAIIVSNRSICVHTLPFSDDHILFNFKLQLPCLHMVSTSGNQFAFYTNRYVHVCQVTKGNVTLMCQFKSKPLRAFQLWMNELICIDNFGCITKYSITSKTVVSVCNQIANILRYPVTTVIHRGIMFIDMKMMKTMLSYWHIALGSPEWALCNMRDNFFWERISSLIDVDEEITTICMRLAIIIAGTNKGRIAFYRHLGCSDKISLTLDDPPWFVISIAPDECISFCDFCMTNNKLHLCVKTKLNHVFIITLPVAEII